MKYHEGRPIVRSDKHSRHVVVLCPLGHYYTSLPMKEWAGSWLEAKATDPRWTVRCEGALGRDEPCNPNP